MSTNKSNHLVNPQAREAMDRFKMEAASQVGVNLTNGYNGELTSRQAGSIGVTAIPKAVPSKVPSASIGAKMPPGAPEEKQSNVVITRAIKINSSRPTEKLPAAAIGIRLKPPPAAAG